MSMGIHPSLLSLSLLCWAFLFMSLECKVWFFFFMVPLSVLGRKDILSALFLILFINFPFFMAHPLSDIAISEIKNLIFFHILFIILVLTFFLKKNMREKKNQHVSCCSSEAVVKFNGCMWTDEGYGPTWDSDDEYDNFIRKMNPPRCIHVLLCSCLSQFWEITIS